MTGVVNAWNEGVIFVCGFRGDDDFGPQEIEPCVDTVCTV